MGNYLRDGDLQSKPLHCIVHTFINFAKSKIDEMQESGVSQTRTNSGQRNAIHCMELQVCRRIRIPEEYMAPFSFCISSRIILLY